MTAKTVVLVAAPSVRTLCPPDMLEGRWMDIPESAQEVAFIGDHGRLEMLARPTGKMTRRPEDGHTAPVWEARRREDWL